MRRIIIFAHYDKNNLIQDYVIYYLQELKKVSDKIIFVSDGEIKEKGLKKLQGLVTHIIAKKHGEYDFGSYKRGYFYALEQGLLGDCDELVFCNDSCYGPLFPIEDIFEKMSFENIDFWGNTANPRGLLNADFPHVQSNFLVLKKQVFTSDIFKSFVHSVMKETNKNDIIIKYEIGLTKYLEDNGFVWDVYCKSSKKIPHSQIFHYKKLIQNDKNSFVKTSIYRFDNLLNGIIPSYKVIEENSNYDIKFIKQDVKFNKKLSWFFIELMKIKIIINKLF